MESSIISVGCGVKKNYITGANTGYNTERGCVTASKDRASLWGERV